MKKALKILIIMLMLTFVSGIVWFIYNPDKYSQTVVENIVDENFKVYPNHYTSPDKFTDTLSLALSAMKFYTLGNYRLAVETFQRYEPLPEYDGYYNLYLGICYFKIGYTNVAIRHFDESAESFTMFNDKVVAKWYLSLAMLKADRIKDAKQILKQLVEQNTTYKKKAQDILKEF